MKYEENFTELKVDVVDLIKKAVPDSFIAKLQEGGIKFEFPKDREFEFKVKYDVTEEGGSCSLKVSWDNDLYEEEDEEDDEKD
ncbi:MAG TPA: transcription initiation factor IIE [Clostridia bacterium]|nr:transcription initiation factor IIE [Clostridia bacterium]